jgi:predicted nucleotidyltransferase
MSRLQGGVLSLPKKSAPLFRRTLDDCPHRRELDQFIDRVKRLDPLLIVLFGSVARGSFTNLSDADVLVVFQECPPWTEIFGCGNGRIEPVVKSLHELRAMMNAGSTLALEIMEDGKVMFDPGRMFPALQAKCMEARDRMGLVRIKGGWKREGPSPAAGISHSL